MKEMVAMRKMKLGLAVVVMGCGGQSLDVGSDPGRGAAGSNTGGGAGYVAVAGNGAHHTGVSGFGAGGDTGTDFGPASGGTRAGAAGSGQADATGGTGATGAEPNATGGTGPIPSAGGGGTNSTGASGSGGRPFTGEEPTWPEPDGCKSDAAGNALVGTWEGALEDFYLQPLLSARLVINGASERGICGTLTWGDTPAPTPTDPAAPYPSQEAWESGSLTGGIDGYPYTLQQGAAQSGLVRFALDALEGYRPWCPIQELFAVDDGYACLPSRGWQSDENGVCQVELPDGGVQEFPIYQCACTGPCDCNESGCFARQGDLYQYELTLADGGDTLLGPAPQRFGHSDYRLHFRRVE